MSFAKSFKEKEKIKGVCFDLKDIKRILLKSAKKS